MTFVVTDVSGNRRLFQAEGCPVHTQEAGDSMLVIHEITDRAPRRVFDVPKQPATSEGLTDTAWHAN